MSPETWLFIVSVLFVAAVLGLGAALFTLALLR